eukprot:CAMPEP_0114591344 /NCGR_PEP_ID=MMETSP0125-20121206/13404_1 /TAXON_ID=485358 ORGANISM="Aristerostoma sp., Strain ATCC 50986" /NCGR_SAMPLE_ID=MMETSP0125 /ASSEMBLY_ACC=CAM_ASM_000245 /LENGTH=31 /DNA_ID= /DNA_START= /DNA_END= /DNA_ORIENTATION=
MMGSKGTQVGKSAEKPEGQGVDKDYEYAKKL